MPVYSIQVTYIALICFEYSNKIPPHLDIPAKLKMFTKCF